MAQLGRFASQFGLPNSKEHEALTVVLENVIIPGIREQIRKVKVGTSTAYDTGSLYQSITGLVDADNSAISIEANDYFAYIDQGVKGAERNRFGVDPATPYQFGSKTGPKGGLTNSIREWAQRKGVPQEAVFPIVRNIYRFGLPTRPLLDPILSDLSNRIVAYLEEGYAAELEETILYLFKNNIDIKYQG